MNCSIFVRDGKTGCEGINVRQLGKARKKGAERSITVEFIDEEGAYVTVFLSLATFTDLQRKMAKYIERTTRAHF